MKITLFFNDYIKYRRRIYNELSTKIESAETETAIKALKDFFEKALSLKLKLQRVSAPLFLLPETGLNDNLNGASAPYPSI